MFKRLEIAVPKSPAQELIEKMEGLLAGAGHAKVDQLHTSPRVSHLAGKGFPKGDLTPAEVRELCGSVLEHIKAHKAAAAK